jgi:hypothetical protein
MGAYAEQQSGQSGDALVLLNLCVQSAPSGVAGRLDVFGPLLYEYSEPIQTCHP